MRLTHLASATVIIEAKGRRILCDPWLTDGEYYGAWAQYPAFDWSVFDPHAIDAIYVSHIHPDHLSKATFARLPKRPVYIHRYEAPFLKANIEALGFAVVEVPHGEAADLGNGVSLRIFAADDCDPALCGLAFGCDSLIKASRGSAQVDSLAVISDGRHTIVNANDCPYALAGPMLGRIRAQYGTIDLLLTGYSGAGPYPQCFALSASDKFAAAAAKKRQFLTQASHFVRALSPRFVLPFAGQYTLCGRLAALDEDRGVPEVDEAAAFLAAAHPGTRPVLLTSGATFDLETGTSDRAWVPVDVAAKRAYRDHVLAVRKLAYEAEPMPGPGRLEALLQAAYLRFERRRQALALASTTAIRLPLGAAGLTAVIPCDGSGVRFEAGLGIEPYVQLTVDPRLLVKLLSGPAQAHWNNAEIGSHIAFERRPDTYDRRLYMALYALHV